MTSQQSDKSTSQTAFKGAAVFDGQYLHHGSTILVDGDQIARHTDTGATPTGYDVVELDGGYLIPGLVDLQVNGGGDIMFNDAPSVATIARICSAHARLGTTSLLPTFITDTQENTEQAITAAIEACKTVPGCAGLHLEGPHLDVKRCGAHDPKLIRPMKEADLDRLLQARQNLPALLVTLAPEAVSPEQVETLSAAGIIVSLGHSDTDYATARRYSEAGASMVTHLFNAMSSLHHREPGLAAAALVDSSLKTGIIADGHHVHDGMLQLAHRMNYLPDDLFLVSDAMATTGGEQDSFTLNGRHVQLTDGRLTLSDGTLAGVHGSLLDGVRYMHDREIEDLPIPFTMATQAPADAAGLKQIGRLKPGAHADMLHLGENLELLSIWQGGTRLL